MKEVIEQLKKAKCICKRVQKFRVDEITANISREVIKINGAVKVDEEWKDCEWNKHGCAAISLPLTKEETEKIKGEIADLENDSVKHKDLHGLKQKLKRGWSFNRIDLVITHQLEQ